MNVLISALVRTIVYMVFHLFCMVIIILALFFHIAADFGIVFNQTSYTVVADHTLALTGIPLVPFTLYFSESVTTLSLFRSWDTSLSGIGGLSTQLFDLQQPHPFPTSFEPPLVGSDAITAATGDNAPEPGNYRYILQVVVVFTQFNVAIETVEVNITLTETPGE